MSHTTNRHPLHGTNVHRIAAPDGAVVEVFATRYGTVAVHTPGVDLDPAGAHALIAAVQAVQAEAAPYAADEAELAADELV